MPALLTTTLSGPSAAAASSIAAATLGGFVTSSATAQTRRPDAFNTFCTGASDSGLRAAIATFAPASESTLAKWLPSPPFAPVTNALRPASESSPMISLARRHGRFAAQRLGIRDRDAVAAAREHTR